MKAVKWDCQLDVNSTVSNMLPYKTTTIKEDFPFIKWVKHAENSLATFTLTWKMEKPFLKCYII